MHSTFESIIAQIGDAGLRMSQINAAEGSAGNASVFVPEQDDIPASFVRQTAWKLPVQAPALVDGWIIVSASGRRLRDIPKDPEATLCLLHVHDQTTATLYAASELQPTSELNSHLLAHNDQIAQHGSSLHAVLHAQPQYLTYLSHLLPPDPQTFSRRLLHWQPETIVVFPEGIGVLPYQVPGSHAQATATAQALQTYRAVVWARHGAIVRAQDIRRTADLIEYAEAAAHYEYLNLQLGEPNRGLSDQELRDICRAINIEQQVF